MTPSVAHLHLVRRIDGFGCVWFNGWISSQASFILTKVLVVLNLRHQPLVQLHCAVRLAKHGLILLQAIVIRSQHVRVGLRWVLILVRKFKSFFIIEAFLDQSGFILTGEKITGHLVRSIITAGDIVMRQWMVKLRIVD